MALWLTLWLWMALWMTLCLRMALWLLWLRMALRLRWTDFWKGNHDGRPLRNGPKHPRNRHDLITVNGIVS